MGNIIKCFDCLDYTDSVIPCPIDCEAAKTLRETRLPRLLNRKILDWSVNLGTYGMGGYGFFGVQLEATNKNETEWLVLTIFSAGSWLLLDNRWLEAHPRYYALQRPLLDSYDEGSWDELSEKITGGIITEAVVKDAESLFTIETNAEKHFLELPQDTTRLSLYGGTEALRTWHPEDSCWDAWVFSRKGILTNAS